MGRINRDLIHSDIRIKAPSDTAPGDFISFRYPEVITLINRAKTYLIKEKNCRPGQKVLLATNGWPQYVAWWTAVAELGMAFVVSDYPYVSTSRSVAKKLDLYGDIEYLVGNVYGGDFPYWPRELTSRFIDRDIIFSYTDETKGNVYLNKEDDVLLYSTSSGTTDTPKVIAHTQKFFYDLLHRNAKLYNLKESDRCLHTKGLHHGSVTGVYFLPTLKYCKYHYHSVATGEVDDKFTEWVDIIQRENINRCLFFYKMPDRFCELSDKNIKCDDLTVYVLAKLTKDNIQTMVGELNCQIFSIFGCTETSGPLFLPEINKNNYTTFDENDFGPILDNFYNINVGSSGKLIVMMPDGSIVDTGDKFTKQDDNFIWVSRENIYRINGETFYLNLLVEQVQNITKLINTIHFDLIFDQSTEMVYMRINNHISLSKLNNRIARSIADPRYRVSKIIVGRRKDFFNGIKFDAHEIRLICRGQKTIK